MANGRHKDFLNAGILGGGAGVPTRRGFRAISTEYIGSPDYKAEFFETFPTVWANAYAFLKSLEADGDGGNGAESAHTPDDAAVATTEQWLTLFLLHYFGIVHLTAYTRDALEKDYDKDLWLALSGTYPSARGRDLSAIKLLETNERTVVGAYYPEIVFFPSRGRTGWSNDKMLSTYLVGNKLSWELASRQLLTSEQKQREFHEHLLRVADLLPSQTFKNKVQKFCERYFHDQVQVSGSLNADPMLWLDVPGNKPPEPREFLERYPLRKANTKGGYNYYLVAGMPQLTPWMVEPILAGCSPYQYRQTAPFEITVSASGREIKCPLEDGRDEIVPLKDLFLSDPPYWCKVSRAAAAYTSKIRTLHKVELRDPVLKQDEVAICLAPVRRSFLEHFPDTFKNLKGVSPSPDVQRPNVEWTFPVLGREVRWHTTPIGQREMPNTTVALWPPKVSRDWTLYAIRATGSKEACGRWHLVSEKGGQGEQIHLEEDEYVSVLQPTVGSNTPKALLFTDNNDNERGVLFFAEMEEQKLSAGDGSKVALSVDFGTSNTCLASKIDGVSSVLKFSLSPEMVWGEKPRLEQPGFVPFRWGGHRGFFPTLLLSRKNVARMDEIKPEEISIGHLFNVDVPGLHAEIEEKLSAGDFNALWETHSKMKWDLDIKSPWRALFLGVTLLYAHAEVFFGGEQGRRINKYIFTFPLAFSETDRSEFHLEMRKSIQKIRHFCYGITPLPDKFDFEYVDNVDESTAIAKAARIGAVTTTMEVFIDVGGGTADIAVRNGNEFLVLDSVKVAGNTFFQIAEKNFESDMTGGSAFKKHLARMLNGWSDRELERWGAHLDFGTYYSLAINRVPDDDFRKREAKVIQDGMGTHSYQRYRSRLLFRHLIAYALLQACAAAVKEKITLEEGIKLILGGNAWGLMLFAELPRRGDKLREEASEILRLLKEKLLEVVGEDERAYVNDLTIAGVELLNEKNLSKAKTDVAVGAINASEDRRAARPGSRESTVPFSGVTVKDLSINDHEPQTIRWCDRWGFDEFKQKFGQMDAVKRTKFDQPRGLKQPLDPVLSVFTRLGNTARNDQDNMPGDTWRDINAELCQEIAMLEGNRLERSPLNYFISKVLYPEDAQRDFLDTLAEENGTFTNER
jgi:hypothetical protein